MKEEKTVLLVAERHREIIAAVDERKSVRVAELAKQFQVTDETIRRDLEKLEADGHLLRSHGGAVALQTSAREMPFAERRVTHVREKTAIARHAASLIQDNDTILFDASSTALQVAKLLPDRDITVITNAINVAVELADRSRVRVVCTGGTLSPLSLSFVGPMAEQMLREYHVNKVFFSCSGVDLDYGLSDINEWQALLKRQMMAMADSVYLLADHSKFGLKSLRQFAKIEDVQAIITDKGISADVLDMLQQANASVTVAE